MRLCPVCNEEYRDGIQVCADCGVDLIDAPLEQEKKPGEYVYRPMTYLMTVAEIFEADRLIALLQEEGVDASKRYEGALGAVRHYGVKVYGTDLYVPESDLARARELVLGMGYAADTDGELLPEGSDARKEAEGQQEISGSAVKRLERITARMRLLIYIPCAILVMIFLAFMFYEVLQ